jgi:ubiquinone biosynthesis protein UbiJ
VEKLRKIILNHVLSQNDWMSTRLKKFHNKTILIKISELSIYFSVNKKGLLEHISHVKNPDASISMPIKSLINQIIHKENKDITIKGDIDLAKEVSEILKKIKWDVEEDLSKIIGDVAANRVGILGEKVLNESKKITISIAEAFKEYWEEEKPLIAKKTRVHQFLVEIDNISEDVERIEAKINSLALKISK